MKVSRHYDGAAEQIRVGNMNLKMMKRFKYLEACFTYDNNMNLELVERFTATSRCFYKLKSIFKSSVIS